MGEKTQSKIEEMLDDAEARGMLLAAPAQSVHRQLNRLAQRGALLRPMPGLYARPSYWSGLSDSERCLHQMRTLAAIHPDWEFCSVSAAVVYGLWVGNRRMTPLVIASNERSHGRSTLLIRRQRIEPGAGEPCVVRGIRVTPPLRTTFDCLRWLPFSEGLAVADSSMRRFGVPAGRLAAEIEERYRGLHGYSRAISTAKFANPLSESGGESMARAIMIDQGFQIPRLQVEIPDPMCPDKTYRVDYLWELPDGVRIIGEFDGREKYRNPVMTGGRDVVDVLADERLRESRLALTGARIMRFSFRDICNVPYFVRLLETSGVPRQRRSGRRRGDHRLPAGRGVGVLT